MGTSGTAASKAALAALVTALLAADASAAVTYRKLAHCSSPVTDRSGDSINEIFNRVGFQKLYKGKELPWYVRERGWTHPTGQTNIKSWRGFGVIGTALEVKNGGHEGVDIGGGSGDPVYAASKGKVVYLLYGCQIGDKMCGNGWGNHVVLSHGDGVYTRYAHLSKVLVSINAEVEAGKVVGKLGTTGLSDGPHLHFEVGTRGGFFEPCLVPQNMDLVYDPRKLHYAKSR